MPKFSQAEAGSKRFGEPPTEFPSHLGPPAAGQRIPPRAASCGTRASPASSTSRTRPASSSPTRWRRTVRGQDHHLRGRLETNRDRPAERVEQLSPRILPESVRTGRRNESEEPLPGAQGPHFLREKGQFVIQVCAGTRILANLRCDSTVCTVQ